MLRKLNGILLSVIECLKRLFGKKNGGEPYSLLRIRRMLYCSGIRHRRGSTPGVWIAKAENFTDACRFMLRLCAPVYIKSIRQAGHIRYKALLPDGSGSILLSDRVGNRKDTVAVMTFAIRQLPEIREIRFSPCKKGVKS